MGSFPPRSPRRARLPGFVASATSVIVPENAGQSNNKLTKYPCPQLQNSSYRVGRRPGYAIPLTDLTNTRRPLNIGRIPDPCCQPRFERGLIKDRGG